MIPSRSVLALAVAVAFAACSDGGGTTPEPTVESVVVTPDGSSVTSIGASVQFTAEARTAAGVPVTGVSFSWTSSNPSVATVDGTGRATSVAFGESTITATVDGVSAGATFSVRDCTETVNLAPGQWAALALPAAGDCGVILPTGQAGDRYRVAIVGTNPTNTNTFVGDGSIEVVPLGGAVSQSAIAPAAAPIASAITPEQRALLEVPGLLDAARTAERTAQFHMDLRERERELIRRLGPENVARPGPLAVAGPLAVDLPQTIQIDPTTPTNCTPAGTKVTANLIWQNDEFAFYQDATQAQTELAVTATQVQRMAAFYAAYGRPIIRDFFDGVSDIDSNGKVIVFITPVVASGTAAFVWSGDFFTTASCPASNQGEYIFFSASIIQAQDNAEGANWQSLETLVHEMKHVSSLKKSIDRPLSITDPYHPSWEEEGSAEIAGNMASRFGWAAVGGPSANARATGQDIVDTGFQGNQGPIKPEFYGVALRMLRAQGFLSSQPNSVVVSPVGAPSAHGVYGSGWTFFRWLADAYGNAASSPGAEADLFKTLNASESRPGIQGLEDLTGKIFPRLMEEFAAAVMLHGTPAPQGTRSFTSYDFVTAIEVWCFAADNPPCDGSPAGPTGAWPWPVTVNPNGTPSRTLQQGATFSGRIGGAGLRVHDFVSSGVGTGAELVVRAPSPARIVVVRIQ